MLLLELVTGGGDHLGSPRVVVLGGFQCFGGTLRLHLHLCLEDRCFCETWVNSTRHEPQTCQLSRYLATTVF